MKTLAERAKNATKGMATTDIGRQILRNIYIDGATEQRDIDIERAWQWMREHIKLIGCEMELHSSFVKAMKDE